MVRVLNYNTFDPGPGGGKILSQDPGGGMGFKDSDPNPGGGRMKEPGGHKTIDPGGSAAC
ncbi:hypothetical protein V7024_17655 [Bacillus sp. JJ864]|uniref:hypothetical protein n=1 Tax=Bacillus sp. JJ864 TaxID=3122975 RepID=UPI002FFD686E